MQTMSKRGRKTEKYLAKRVNAKQQPASGATWHSKGDVIDETFLYDNKLTSARSFTITDDLWHKVFLQAMQHMRIPILAVQMPSKYSIIGTKLIVMDEDAFISMKEEFVKRQGYMEEP